MGVQFDAATVLSTDHRPGLLNVHLQGVIRAEERVQVMGDLSGQLPVQPLKGIRPMQLIKAGMPEQITGEVVAVTEVLMAEETTIEARELPFHGRGRRGIGL